MSDLPELIFCPGLLCDEALWRPQATALGGRMAMRVADTTKDDTIAGMAARLLADAPPRFALAGLSMGGYLALEVLRQAKDRVTRVALLDTSARPDTEEQQERRRALMRMAQVGRFKGVTPRLLPLLIHPDRMEDAALVETIVSMAQRIGREGFLRQQNAILTRADSVPDLPGFTCPALVIVGKQDALTPPERSEEIAAGLPNAKLIVLENCGHLASLEQPEIVSDLFEDFFLAEAA